MCHILLLKVGRRQRHDAWALTAPAFLQRFCNAPNVRTAAVRHRNWLNSHMCSVSCLVGPPHWPNGVKCMRCYRVFQGSWTFWHPLNSWQDGPILMPFEWVNKHTGRFVLRYNEAWYLVRWLQDRRGRPKLSFWNTKFLGKYSVNLNLSNKYSLLFRSHLGMYQA